MFTLPGKPNTGANVLANIANSSVEGLLERNRESRENETIKEGLKNLSEDSSPIDWIRAINNMAGISDKKREQLYKVPEMIGEYKKKGAIESQKIADQQKEDKRKADLAVKYGLDPDEVEDLKSSDIPAYARSLKEPKIPIGEKPVPKEYSEKIEKILAENPRASAEKLELEFDKEGIPPGYTSRYTETRRRDQERETTDKGKTIDIHNSWSKYDEELRSSADTARKQIEAMKDIQEALEEGASDPFGLVNWAKNFGPLGETLSNAFLSAAQGKMGAAIPQLIEGFRQLFGQRITDADLRILQDKLPSFGKTKEANEAILKILKKYAEPAITKYEVAKEIRKENKGFRPIDYDYLIDERMELKNEKGKESKEARVLTDSDLDFYLQRANNDPEKAAEMAKRDGYVW